MSAVRLNWVWCAAGLLGLAFAGSAAIAQEAPSNLLRAIESGDDAACIKAADEIGGLGSAGAKAVPALTEALGKRKGEAAWHVARALGAIGPAAKSAVPALTAKLSDADAKVKAYAAFALGEMGDASKPAAEGLVKLLADADPLVRRAAVTALRKIKPGPDALPYLVKLLEDSQPPVIMAALNSISEAGAKGVPVLVEALKNKKARYWAILALTDLGPEAKEAVGPLSELLSDSEEELRMQVIHALAAIGPEAKSAGPQLLKIYQGDKEPSSRYSAGYALAKIGVAEASEAFEKGATDKDPFLALVSAWGHAQLHPNDKEIVTKSAQQIIAGLTSENAKLRMAAAQALSESKASPELAAPAFEKAMADTSPEVKITAIKAVAAMGSKAVPRLALAIQKSPSKEVRESAMRVIALIGAEAKEAVPALVERLAAEKDPLVRREIQVTLAMIGPAAAPALAELKKSLAAEQEEVRLSAIYALGKIGPAAAEAIPELRKNIAPAGEDRFERLASVWALLRIKPGDSTLIKIAVPLLTRALESERENVRAEAATALGDLGAPAATATEALAKLRDNDSSDRVRAAAEGALKKLGKATAM